jgi:hypothetical protein
MCTISSTKKNSQKKSANLPLSRKEELVATKEKAE